MRRERLRELAQDIGDLALRAAFVHMVIPAADVGKRDLHAEVRLDELRELLQAVAETATRIIRAGRGLVLRWIGRLQHLHRIEGLLARAMQHRVDRLVIHRFEGVGDGRRVWVASANAEIVDVIHGDRTLAAGQDARQSRAQRDGAEGGLVRG